ncbi:transmembrane protein 184C-like [Asterias rubens]|uniref:transmembrane protein 184C-like n=1 Tax=Asterias rubens TaxID=7604 RepID=UPI001455D304|nr:transmembrane protein 184C-like [Asterias rubens]
MDSNQGTNTAERGGARAAPPGNITDSRSSLSWRGCVIPVVYVIYGLIVAAATPFAIIDFTKASKDDKFKRTLALVGFVPMVISIPISLWGIVNHMIYFTRPNLQKHIIRILLMVPIYVLNSWFALRFPENEIYFDTIRELYKALTIYNVVYYLVAFFDGVPDFDNRMAMKSEIKLPHPLCCLKKVPNKRTIRRCKLGVLNYAVVRIIATIITIITHVTGSYNEGDFSAGGAYSWLTGILTFSEIWAIFSKNLLRRATKEELKLLPRSTLQLLAVQFVVFFTHFQATILNILASTGVIKTNTEWGFEDEFAFATMLQDLLICIEMVAFAALFTYAFDYQRYNTDEPRLSFEQIFIHMWTISGLKSSINEHLGTRGNNSNSYQSTDLVRSEEPPAVDEVHPNLQYESPTEPRLV